MSTSTNSCDYRTEFPDFGDLDVQIPAGFTDVSWHNDAMPSFEMVLPCDNKLRLWIDYKDLDKSEVKQERFMLFSYDHDETTSSPALLVTNDFSAMVQFIERYTVQQQ